MIERFELLLQAPPAARTLALLEAVSVASVVAALTTAVAGLPWAAFTLVVTATALDAVAVRGRAGALRLLHHVKRHRWLLLALRLAALALIVATAAPGTPVAAALVALVAVVAVGQVLVDWNGEHLRLTAEDVLAESQRRDLVVLDGLEVGSTTPARAASRQAEVERQLDEIADRMRWRDRGRFPAASRFSELLALAAAGLHLAGVAVLPALGLLLVGVAPVAAVTGLTLRARRVGTTAAREARRLVPTYLARYQEAVVEAVQRLDPTYVIYLYAFDASYYTLYEWSDLLAEASGRGLVIVVGPEPVAPPRPVGLPVVHAASGRAALACLAPSTTVAFYVTDSVRNVDFMRRSTIAHGLRHVFLNHGDSDKPVNASPSMRLFDEIWVPGQMAVDRFQRHGVRMDERAFRMIGRPQTASLQDIHVHEVEPRRTLRILYAPTWESFSDAENFSSLRSMGERLVRGLLASEHDLELVVRPHPATGTQDRRFAAAVDRLRALVVAQVGARVDGEADLHDQLRWSDLLVADISAVATEYLATGRPLVVCNAKGLTRDELDRRYPTTGAAYVLEEGDDVGALIDTILTADPRRDDRLQMRSYAFEYLGDASVEAFHKAVADVCAS